MRIFFYGAQGTGKSTLVDKLKFILPEYKIMDSPSRLFLHDKTIQRNINTSEYMDFQKKILLYCLNYYVSKDNFYSSRSIIDSYAYLQYALKQSDNYKTTSFLTGMLSLLDTYADLCFNSNAIYFYLPIEFKLNNSNPLRDTDPQYQKDIDQLMLSSVKHIKDKFTILDYKLSGSVEERMEQINTTLKSLEIK